jgi:antitoxin MazE
MDLQVNRWGNSLAVRLPASLVKELSVKEGSVLSTQELGQRLLAIRPSINQAQLEARKKLIESIREMHKSMPITEPVSKDELSRY